MPFIDPRRWDIYLFQFFQEEIAKYNIDPKRVGIDRNTMVITQSHVEQEIRLGLSDKIGSTKSGTGAATADRVLRDPNVNLAKDFPALQSYLTDVAEEVYKANQSQQNVIIEGTQGSGLSIFHTPQYPYATGRDTNAAGFISEVGISPRDVTDIVMILRAFPIRVAGKFRGIAQMKLIGNMFLSYLEGIRVTQRNTLP